MKDIITMIRNALSSAMAVQVEAGSPSGIHRKRSSNWVESLAQEFREYYKNDSVKVFSKEYKKNRADFLINELLFDVCVCRVGKVASNTHKKKLYYVKEALWQVESEFAKDSRQALVDFNKLVLGAAKNKLFIGPHVHDTESFINVLLPPAAACSGSVFLCLLPHPSEWHSGNDALIELFEYFDGKWKPCEE